MPVTRKWRPSSNSWPRSMRIINDCSINCRSAEQAWAQRKQQLEAERKEALATAEQDLKAYEEQIAPQVAQGEQKRAEAIAQAEAAVKDFDANLDQHFQQWADQQGRLHRVVSAASQHAYPPPTAHTSRFWKTDRYGPKEMRKREPTPSPSRRIWQASPAFVWRPCRSMVFPAAARGCPKTATSSSRNSKCVPRMPPTPANLQPVALQQPLADFTQQGFDINQAIDGVTQDQLGWAVAPAGGTVHWATFPTKEPIAYASGTVLQVTHPSIPRGEGPSPRPFSHLGHQRRSHRSAWACPNHSRPCWPLTAKCRSESQQQVCCRLPPQVACAVPPAAGCVWPPHSVHCR